VFQSAVSRCARLLWTLSIAGLNRQTHIVRYQMYRRIKEATQGLDLSGKVLSVSRSEHLCHLIGIRTEQITTANYPAFTLCSLNIESDSYDVVVSDQVLEHVHCNPQEAVDEIFRVLKPGGVAINTTCFLTPFHGEPVYGAEGAGDYWRFTCHGLRYLHRRYSSIIAADGWGNPFMGVVNALGLTRMPVPDETWHPLHKLATHNRDSYHYVVWIVAQK